METGGFFMSFNKILNMNRVFTTFVAICLTATFLNAQSVKLTFTARSDSGQYVQLSSVDIRNITKGWLKTLTWPDTVLKFQGTGVEDLDNGIFFSQNVPNPFYGTTQANLYISEPGAVEIFVTDMAGRVVATTNRSDLFPGSHSVGVSLSSAGGGATSLTGKYYYVNTAGDSTHGFLYNWPAAMNGHNSSSASPSQVQWVCPEGWHLLSDNEWKTLTDFIGGVSLYQCGGNCENVAKLLASQTGWNSCSSPCSPRDQSSDQNNATNFTAVPAGSCFGPSFNYAGGSAFFWTSTQSSANGAWFRNLRYDTLM